MKFTIKYKLASLILIIVIPVVILSTRHYSEMLTRNKLLINSRNQEIAMDVAHELDAMIAESHNVLLPLARHPAVTARDREACNRLFASLLPSFTDHLNILAAGADGRNFGSAIDPASAKGLNYRDKEWFRKGSRGVPTVGDLHVSKLFKVPAIMMTVPVFGPNGRQAGVLGFPLNLVKVNELLARRWKFPANSSIKVLDSRGDIVFDTLHPLNIGSRETDPHILGEIGKNTSLSEENPAADGISRLYSFAPLSRVQWTVVVGVPSREAYRAVNQFARNYLIMLMLAGFAATALAFFLIRRFNGNVALLVDGLREIEQGNLRHRLTLTGNDELTAVAESFNRMTEARMKADSAIKASETFLSSVLEGIGEGVIVVDREFRIISANSSYCKQVETPSELAVGNHCYRVSHHLDRPCFDADPTIPCPLKLCFETGEHQSAIHTHYDGADTPRFIEMNAYPMKSDTGEIISVVETLKDVTNKVMLEKSLEEAKEKYRKLYDDAPDMMQSIDAAGSILICNKTEAAALGYTPEEMIGRNFTDFIFPEAREGCRQKFMTLMEQGFMESEATLQTRDGRLIPIFAKAKVIYDDQGRFLMADVTFRDITERKQAEQKIKDAELSYRTLFEQSPEGIIIVDTATLLPVMFNDTACSQLGYSREEFAALRITDHDDDNSRITPDRLEKTSEGERDDFELRCRTRGGEIKNVLATVRKLELSGRSVIFCIFRDVTEIKRTEAALRENEKRLNHLAHHDPLTNLPNRILFYDRLRHAMAKASRSNYQVAVLFLDLDRFKNINDTLGHKTGDQVLCKMARLLKGHIRESDTVARLGGDEFLIILERVDDLTYAGLVAQKLLSDLSKAIFTDGQELYVTASIGISIFPADSDNVEGLMKCADVAMYRAKDRGRNTYQFYTPDMNARAHELLLLESSLRKALELEQLILHYQPLFDVKSGRLVALEALLRWQHPTKGMILPGEFIHLAEETGLIVPIGEWVLRTACKQIKTWQDKGHPPIHVSVNISGRQFRHVDMVRTVGQALEEIGLDPALLSLEITESVIMHEVESTIETLYELNRMGVQLAIDDFGTGYSSLGYLKRFPIAKLKIDRSFIRDVTSDPNDAAIVTSIIALGLGMNMEVIAEGIETEEQLSFLCEKGCKFGQGFLFSRPLPPADVVNFMQLPD